MPMRFLGLDGSLNDSVIYVNTEFVDSAPKSPKQENNIDVVPGLANEDKNAIVDGNID